MDEDKDQRLLAQALRQRGVTLYLASGTDHADLEAEARALGFADLFNGGIYGATGDLDSCSKKMVLDRIPPVADLTVGMVYQHSDKLAFGAYAYNTLNSRYFQPDPFGDHEPRLEFLPNPSEDFYFRVNATYSY